MIESDLPQLAPRRAGYPLMLLFLGLTWFGSLLAMNAAVLRNSKADELWTIGVAASLGTIAGGALGMGAGLFHARLARGVGLGLLAGITTGALLFPLLTTPSIMNAIARGDMRSTFWGTAPAPSGQFASLLMIALVGSVIMLGLAFLARQNSIRERRGRADDHRQP